MTRDPGRPQAARAIGSARDDFLSSGDLRGDTARRSVRPLVAQSWARSMRLGLALDARPPIELADDDLEAYRSAHPLATAMPLIRSLLVDGATDAGVLIVVSDADGRLLWVEGSSAVRRRAEAIHFLPGARWSEAVAGTNAPGTALALDTPVQIFATEHLAPAVTTWSCTAAPLHDRNGRVIGALDVTGGDDAASAQCLLLVRAVAAAVETELRHPRRARRRTPAVGPRRHGGPAASPAPTRRPVQPPVGRPVERLVGQDVEVDERWRLEVLADVPRQSGPSGAVALRLRHAELLTVLQSRPEGVSGEQLGMITDPTAAPVTLRAELSRLRAVLEDLPDISLLSRPRRLVGCTGGDLADVRRRLARSDIAGALAAYRGDLLPASTAPEVERQRRLLLDDLRAAVLACNDADLLWSFAQRPCALDDVTLWQACLDVLPAGSPRASLARQRIARLDAELSAPASPLLATGQRWHPGSR